MVSENSFAVTTNKICNDQIRYKRDKVWLSNRINKMSKTNKTELNINQEDKDNETDNTKDLVRNLLNDICENAINTVESGTVMIRGKHISLQEQALKTNNRRVSILDDDKVDLTECCNNYVKLHRRTVSECYNHDSSYVLDENDNNDYTKTTKDTKRTNEKEKKKKRISFHSLFGKKDKKPKESKEEEEKHDNLAQLPVFNSNTLGKSKKYASALELSHKTVLQRTPSFIKKLVHISEEPITSLKRSLSFRDLHKKPVRVASREKMTEKRNQEWRQSLQSLVESDITVSYNDLSFINYDALNDINYEPVALRAGKGDKGYIGRTQSMIEKVSLLVVLLILSVSFGELLFHGIGSRL